MKEKIIVIAGPTASGKTDKAIELALKINGEVISADSMQVYKYMDIGTAKPSEDELLGVKHYLIDEVYPDEDFSVAHFCELAKNAIKEITEKGKTPIIAGGTGFYINALLKDTDFSDDNEKDTEYREELSILAKTNGNEYVHNMLKEVDFGSYEKIHPNNIKRVIRALEFYKQTGQKISVHNLEEKSKKSPYDAEIFILDMDRAKLYERINERVDIMMKKGLIEEVENLLKMGYNETLTSMQGLGYKEIVPFLKGEWTKDFAIEILKRDTRRFAKRQLTWFRHQIDEGVLVDRNEQIQLFTR